MGSRPLKLFVVFISFFFLRGGKKTRSPGKVRIAERSEEEVVTGEEGLKEWKSVENERVLGISRFPRDLAGPIERFTRGGIRNITRNKFLRWFGLLPPLPFTFLLFPWSVRNTERRGGGGGIVNRLGRFYV